MLFRTIFSIVFTDNAAEKGAIAGGWLFSVFLNVFHNYCQLQGY